MKQWILASQSPRRRELLTMAGMDFICQPSSCNEEVPEGIVIEKRAEYLAELKAAEAAAKYPDDLILGADTLVVCGDRVMGKPSSEEEAFEMLSYLSGKKHYVYTGVALIGGGRKETFTSAAEVEFYELTPDEIRAYTATGEPMDKAGAYGIQGKGCVLVKGIRGDYYTIVGLPVAETVRRMKRFSQS